MKELMRILKVDSVAFLMAKTSNGELYKVYRKGQVEPFYTLDAVPVSEETEKEIKKFFDDIGTPHIG